MFYIRNIHVKLTFEFKPNYAVVDQSNISLVNLWDSLVIFADTVYCLNFDPPQRTRWSWNKSQELSDSDLLSFLGWCPFGSALLRGLSCFGFTKVSALKQSEVRPMVN